MSILITIIVFSILIIVHEFGHFIAARQAGIRVERFAIGFGPAIIKIKGKETQFLVCLFPLGGYVKLAGDNRKECKGKDDEFFSKPVGVRARVVFAGVFFNYILAFVVFCTIAFIGMPYQETIVGGVLDDYPAQGKLLKTGDKVLEVNGVKVNTWSEMEKIIRKSTGVVKLDIKRGYDELSIAVPLEKEEVIDEFGRAKEVPSLGIYPYQDTVVGGLAQGYPAQSAGIQRNDKILEVNGIAVDNWEEMADIIHKAKNEVSLVIEREGQKIPLTVSLREKEITNDSGEKETVSLIGIAPLAKIDMIRFGFPKAFVKGGESLWKITSLMIKWFGYVISGSASFREGAAGPIGIFYYTSQVVEGITADAIRIGIVALLQLIATLNVSLAIINLFPIPILDGGHILFNFIEKIRNKPMSERAEDIAMRFGLAFIGLLIVFILYNDIEKYGSQIWKKIRNKGNNSASEYITLEEE